MTEFVVGWQFRIEAGFSQLGHYLLDLRREMQKNPFTPISVSTLQRWAQQVNAMVPTLEPDSYRPSEVGEEWNILNMQTQVSIFAHLLATRTQPASPEEVSAWMDLVEHGLKQYRRGCDVRSTYQPVIRDVRSQH